MEQATSTNALPSKTTSPSPDSGSTSQTPKQRKLPTPRELISHYESQGLDTQEASIKVIEDLQRALFGVISSGRGKKDKLMVDTSRKIDAVNNRLTILDMKVDSKPGYAETFAIGIGSGAALRGIGSVMPHIIGAVAHIWNSVTNATKSSTP
ncbi:putative Ribosomal-like protein [Quillaja saponaria]|uniref:Ribosomal-like protein n=1 Tax=Quillaja saponaria TaxID=32244 RepID=A0AAD7PEQ0_QUISA|nr:putative Ribosomal-like protein [Quillaja saponaria]